MAGIANGELVCQRSGKRDMSQTPMQIVVARDRTDRRTDAYVDTLRLAFEGSADSAGSPTPMRVANPAATSTPCARNTLPISQR